MSVDYASRVTRQLAEILPVQSKLGVFVKRDGIKAVVNIGLTTVTLPFVGMYLPPTGHPVQLEMRDGQLVVSGPARPLPGVGKITGTGSPRATVTAWGVPYLLPYRSGYTPVMGHDVEIAWTADGGVIQGQVTATSDVVAPGTNPGGGGGAFHPSPFTAIDSGSRYSSGGWVNSDVYASSSMTGGWFYGSKIRDTIPDAATITLARIYLSPRQTQFGPPRLQVHTSPSKAGALTWVGSYYELGSRSGWVSIPVGFIDYLKVNPGGLGMNHGGYDVYRGVPADGLSGALDIAWTV